MTTTKVTVRLDGKPVTFRKQGTKAYLCSLKPIHIGRKVFYGRKGGRTLCGPRTGANSPKSKDARDLFYKRAKSGELQKMRERAARRRRRR